MYPNTNDGNMATTSSETSISPVGAVSQEDDMIAKVKEYIDRGINALVNQSKVAAEVEQLRQDIAGMRESLDKIRKQNDWLDEQLVRIRGERDKAISDAQIALHSTDDLQIANADLQRSLDSAKRLLGEDDGKIATLTKERDDAQFRVMELEDQYTKAKTAFQKALEAADDVDQILNPHVEPKPVVQQVPITQSWDTSKPVDPSPSRQESHDEPWQASPNKNW